MSQTRHQLETAARGWSVRVADSCPRGGELGEKVERLRNTNGYLQSSHRDVRYSRGNIFNNIVMTMYGARWVLEISG